MKKALLAAIACAPLLSFAQSPAPSAAPSVASTPAMRRPGGMTILTPAERQTLMDANKKAKLDPTVVAADQTRKDAMKAVRQAMVAKDPSITSVVAKIEAASSPGAARLTLSANERAQLHDDGIAVQNTPEGLALKKANSDYNLALRKAMVAADPAVVPVLMKLHLIGERVPVPAASPGAAATSPSPAASAAAASPATSP